jgi:hypothetical protein
MNFPTIGILYICTGHYTLFWQEFYLSMEQHFILDAEKHYFVFTDSPEIDFEKENPRIHRIYQKNLGWPDITLKRFHIFLESESMFAHMDYLFFFNANLQVLEPITAKDFLPSSEQELVATLHPGFFNKKRPAFTYDNNKKSYAYMPPDQGRHYFAGGLNGGKTAAFISAMKTMREWIDRDAEKHIIALWHDESHWNKYLIQREDVKILPPAYLYPEGWQLPFSPIILVRDKNKFGGHSALRNERISLLTTLKKTLRRIFANARKLVRKLSSF